MTNKLSPAIIVTSPLSLRCVLAVLIHICEVDVLIGSATDSTSDNRTLCYATQAGEPRVGWQKILWPHLTSGHLTLQIAISLIIMWGTQLSKRPINLYSTKDKLMTMIMKAFTDSNRETARKVYWQFWSHLEAMVEANGNFFESI